MVMDGLSSFYKTYGVLINGKPKGRKNENWADSSLKIKR